MYNGRHRYPTTSIFIAMPSGGNAVIRYESGGGDIIVVIQQS